MAGPLLFLLLAAVVLTGLLAAAIIGVMMVVNGRKGRLAEIERLDAELSELERNRPPRDV